MSPTQTATQTDFLQARYNMMEQQIRPWDVLDQNVLNLVNTTPRELFIPPEYKNLAYADIKIPIGHDQYMLEPRVEARLVQSLEISKLDNILEIGTGTGYTTALLAQLGRSVTSVDYYDDFLDQAAFRLKSLNIHNVSLHQGCAAHGWDAGSAYEFDAILINGTLPSIPDSYKQLMNRSGRLLAFTGAEPTIAVIRIRRVGENDWHSETLFEANAPQLLNTECPASFVF